jgi:hypothetical protein
MRTNFNKPATLGLSVLAAIAIGSCSYTPEQINFVLDMETVNGEIHIESVLKDVSHENDLTFSKSYSDARSSTLSVYMVYNFTETAVVQNQMDDCKFEKSKFSSCFSASKYAVSVYRSTILRPRIPLACLANDIILKAKEHGGSLVGRIERSPGVALSCPN